MEHVIRNLGTPLCPAFVYGCRMGSSCRETSMQMSRLYVSMLCHKCLARGLVSIPVSPRVSLISPPLLYSRRREDSHHGDSYQPHPD